MNPSESPQPPPSGLQVEVRTTASRWLNLRLMSLLAVVVGAGAWIAAQQSGPSVRWATPAVVEFLLPSSAKKITVSFRSNQDLSDVAVFVTPSLSSRVTPSPKTFRRIRANRDNQLTLELSAPPQSQVKFEGTVHLRSTSVPTQTYAEPLSITLLIHNEPVPPDPGEAGKQTLEGIDSDGDGVRDDVQRWIVLTYLGSQKTQLALKQSSIALQDALLAQDAASATKAASEESAAARCLGYVSDDIVASDTLTDAVLNTDLRRHAYGPYLDLLTGRVPTRLDLSTLKAFCTFDPDSLAN